MDGDTLRNGFKGVEVDGGGGVVDRGEGESLLEQRSSHEALGLGLSHLATNETLYLQVGPGHISHLRFNIQPPLPTYCQIRCTTTTVIK